MHLDAKNGHAPKSQNLGEDQFIQSKQPYKPSLDGADHQADYSLAATQRGANGQPYSREEQKEIEELKDRDLEVRRHEQAHFRAAGRYGSPPTYEYQTGPDGRRYAVGGSVDIDMSEVPNDPQATLEKARIIKRAALAPEEPSAQDRKVAREADEMATQAQQEISEEQTHRVEDHGGALESTKAKGAPEPTETSDEAIQKVAVAHVEFPVESFTPSRVTRYNTSRLEIGGFAGFRLAQLEMPGQYFSYTGMPSSVDLYV